ncbi:MAG TPA: TIGR03086 family metal-binding protein [Acidimicrobiales bacterium]
MSDLTPACDRMIEVVAGVASEQLASPTCCTDYTVGDLIDHVDLVAQGATALARGLGQLSNTNSSHLEPDWQATVIQHVQTLGKAWDDPVAWEGVGNVPGSDLSNATWGKITLTELVVHGWDIATATGQSFDLPDRTL